MTKNFIQRQKEHLHAKIIRLEDQLDKKQKLELEIEQLRGSLGVMEHMKDDGDAEVLDTVNGIITDLREKEQSLEELDALNQMLIIRERKSNDELQEAHKELIEVSFGFVICLQLCDSFSLRFSAFIQSAPFNLHGKG